MVQFCQLFIEKTIDELKLERDKLKKTIERRGTTEREIADFEYIKLGQPEDIDVSEGDIEKKYEALYIWFISEFLEKTEAIFKSDLILQIKYVSNTMVQCFKHCKGQFDPLMDGGEKIHEHPELALKMRSTFKDIIMRKYCKDFHENLKKKWFNECLLFAMNQLEVKPSKNTKENKTIVDLIDYIINVCHSCFFNNMMKTLNYEVLLEPPDEFPDALTVADYRVVNLKFTSDDISKLEEHKKQEKLKGIFIFPCLIKKGKSKKYLLNMKYWDGA